MRAEKQLWPWFAFHHEPKRRQVSISDMENGKVEIGSGTLALLAAVLNKPISYFFPSYLIEQLEKSELTTLEKEILLVFRNIWNDHLQKLVVDQIRLLAEFDPEEMIIGSLDIITNKIERLDQLKKILRNRK